MGVCMCVDVCMAGLYCVCTCLYVFSLSFCCSCDGSESDETLIDKIMMQINFSLPKGSLRIAHLNNCSLRNKIQDISEILREQNLFWRFQKHIWIQQ